VLTYDNLDAHSGELHGRLNFHGRWFLKGALGIGSIFTGVLHDEDYFAGQVKFSDTTSSVPEGWLAYGNIDFGGQDWIRGERSSSFGAFIGYGQWTEFVDAYGATDHMGFIGGDISRDVKVISNKAVWKALRVGFAGDFALGSRARFGLDLAAIPYAKVRDEDSHHLRSDLGPVPNIVLEGEGWGVQADAELRYEIARRTELGLGVRYWYMEARDGTRQLPNLPGSAEVPLVELYSQRTGVTLSLRRIW
jgi:hypothetical protein